MSAPRIPLSDLAVLVRALLQLRRGPADAPYSPRLLGALVAASILLDAFIGSAVLHSTNALARTVVSTSLMLALCAIALSIRGSMSRFVQTATALIACGMAFSLLVLPILALLGPVADPPAAVAPLQVLLALAWFALLLWSLAVNAHIVRQAMEASFGFGLALVAAWTVAGMALESALFDAAK